MNQLILFFRTYYHFILFGHELGGSLVFISQVDILDHVSMYTVYIDTSKYGFASGMFLQIVSVSYGHILFVGIK